VVRSGPLVYGGSVIVAGLWFMVVRVGLRRACKPEVRGGPEVRSVPVVCRESVVRSGSRSACGAQWAFGAR